MGISPFGSFFGRHEFLIRRLHSLTGAVFVGGYLAFHLITNAAVIDGAATYQRRADQIHVVGPTTLFFLEWGLVLLPILFHGLIGMVIVARGKRNVLTYRYQGNIRYTLQRITGVLVFAFILWHVFQMRGWFEIPWWREHVTRRLGGGLFDYHNAAATAGAAIRASNLIVAAYVLGVVVSVYHLANGLWTMGATWGVWTSVPAQRRANVPCTMIGIALLAVGLGALLGMLRVPVATGPATAASLAAVLGGVGLLVYESAERKPGDCPNFRPTKMGLSPSRRLRSFFGRSNGKGH
jgi:succinate dehydrogenase / fumarate reductase cytochrome b subunit